MSGAISATTATLIAAGVSAAAGIGTSVYSANQQRKSANKANDLAKQQAADAAKAPGTQRAKAPDQTLLNSAAGIGDNATSGSAANTLLTGSAGVDPNNLQLGKNSLGGSMLGANSLLGA